jgi:AAT family amino acid transporter
MKVNRLGEFEYWFAMVKVGAIVAFIIVGLSLILSAGSEGVMGAANLTRHGGFLPQGWKGVWLSLTITVTSYMGVEIIAVTAGEAENPEVTIPRAMRSIVWRLILFYVLAIAVMVAMVPWNPTAGSSTLSGSPFVTAFASAHVPFAASIMNFVVLTAALSSMNTNLYFSTRMLFSLGRGGYAPEWLGKVSRNGVPRRALLASTAGIVAAILLAIFAPRNAFLMLYGVAVAGMLFVWLVILNTHLRFAVPSRASGYRVCPCVYGATRFLRLSAFCCSLRSRLQPLSSMDCTGRYRHFWFSSALFPCFISADTTYMLDLGRCSWLNR